MLLLIFWHYSIFKKVVPLKVESFSHPRFKQWMSDTDWRPEIFRYLPSSAIRDASCMVPDCAFAMIMIDFAPASLNVDTVYPRSNSGAKPLLRREQRQGSKG